MCIRDRTKDYNRIQKFEKEIRYGLSFICVCCERILFKRAVLPITKVFIQELEAKNLLYCINQKDDYKFEENFYICRTCYSSFKRSKMPSQCFQNNLQVPEIPEALQDLTDLEIQLLSKNILFLKVRQLPKTRMNTLNDRVICVPIEDDDVVKTVDSLPRNSTNNGLVWVRFKRQLGKKSHYLSEMVRPQKIYEALHCLKSHHPAYKNIQIAKFDIMGEMFETSKADDTIIDSDDENHSDSEEEHDTPQVSENIFNFLLKIICNNKSGTRIQCILYITKLFCICRISQRGGKMKKKMKIILILKRSMTLLR